MTRADIDIYLKEPFLDSWNNADVYNEVAKISAQASQDNVYRHKEGRRTLRFDFQQQAFFLKHHLGIGWGEIIKNLIQGRLPVLGARNEFEAALALQALQVDTLTPVAYGCRGKNPARQESFLITRELVDTVSLEDYCRHWSTSPPSLQIKRALIDKLADIAKVMHGAGINHRDFYLCHFLLEKDAEQKISLHQPFHCYLIDLHRCEIRKSVPYRWQIKDLGGLLYSAMDAGLSARDCWRFIRRYTGMPLHKALATSLWADVYRNAEKLYQKDFQRMPPPIKGMTRNGMTRNGIAAK